MQQHKKSLKASLPHMTWILLNAIRQAVKQSLIPTSSYIPVIKNT